MQVGSATIAYRVQGHGPAMMLVHGYPLSGELFAKNRAALARRYTVVTPDLRGFGSSTTPDTKGGVELYAKDMLAVMDHLHIRKAIIGGMSMGGPVVLEMYREAPQRFRGMVLIDSTSSPANDVEKAQWPGFGQQARDKGVASMIPVLMPQMLTDPTRTANPRLVKLHRRHRQERLRQCGGRRRGHTGDPARFAPDAGACQSAGAVCGRRGRSDLPGRDGPEDASGHARLASGRRPRRGPCRDHREAGSLQPGDCRLGQHGSLEHGPIKTRQAAPRRSRRAGSSFVLVIHK